MAPGADKEAGPGADVLEARLRRSVESINTGARRMKRSPTLGPQAELTRRKLADSARELFREHGYTKVTVAEIAQNAHVSLATFYQYFEDVHDVTALVIVDFVKASLASELDSWDPLAGLAGLHDFVGRFLGLYVRNADLLELWEVGKLVSPRLRALYQDYSAVYRGRLEECVRRGVEHGVVRADLDPAALADLLATLTERYCYEHFVLLGEREVGDGVELLTTALTGLLGLRSRPRRKRPS
jgi:TetR/AcrR family transcriptional regulator